MATYPSERAHGLMFHHFHDAKHPIGQGSISAEDLAELLKFVGLNRIRPAHEWLELERTGKLRQDDVCLTFDDSLLCQYEVALPVLRRFGLTAFWFTYTSIMQGQVESLEVYRYFRSVKFPDIERFYDAFGEALRASKYYAEIETRMNGFDPKGYLSEFAFYSDRDRQFRFIRDKVLGVGRYNEIMNEIVLRSGLNPRSLAPLLWMNVDHLRDLVREGHIIGLHSHSHPTQMATLTPCQQTLEYQQNFNFLRSEVGTTPIVMSHPCNSYNDTTLAILRNLGIQLGFRANMTSNPTFGRLEHPREDHAIVMKLVRSA